MHASLSETYGNVLGEALWCGTPTVAFADGMGVSSQIQDGVNGVLFAPGKGEEAEAEPTPPSAAPCVELSATRRRARASAAPPRSARASDARRSPCSSASRDAFQHAQDHAVACGPPARRRAAADDAVADDARGTRARGRRSTASSTWAATCGPPRAAVASGSTPCWGTEGYLQSPCEGIDGSVGWQSIEGAVGHTGVRQPASHWDV